MCGILAYFSRTDAVPISRERFDTMLDQMSSRGPDERSVFIHGRVGLGHRRLSVIDLSTGAQPAFNEDKSLACILNGEIYNFRQLRSDLLARGHSFTSMSDTEVIVHLYEEHGTDLFARLDGMFALVLFDKRRATLYVARDRVGEKPLYYHDSPGMFLCASELKALMKCPTLSRELDPEAVAAYLSSLYVPAPLSILKSVKKLEPGHFLEISAAGVADRAFWSPTIHVDWSLGEAEAIEGIRSRFSQAVGSTLIADVPLGVFLSGGIDSSSVVAFMARHAPSRIKTYAVGFGSEINELPYARMVADRYGTDHTEIVIQAHISEELPGVAAYFDEPFADTSSVPTYLLSREARKYVKVALTGDGGDELFAGYEAYVWQKYQASSRLGGRLARLVDDIGRRYFGRTVLDRCYPFTRNNGSAARWQEVRHYFSSQEISTLVKIGLPSGAHAADRGARMRIAGNDPLSIAFQHDINYYLADDLLKKVDMAAMAHGLECRAPFLNHRLLEYSLTIPPHLKLRNNIPKYLLRKAMEPDLPKDIVWREKHGFGAPIAAWMRGDLRPMIADLLGQDARVYDVLDRRGVEAIVRSGLDESVDGDWRRPFRLWIVFMFELWMRTYC